MEKPKTITMFEHESEVVRLERIVHRLWILVIIIFVALVITNGAWIYYESQFEVVEETTTEQTVTQDVKATGDSDAVLAGIGDAYGGKSEADSQEEDDYEAVSQKEEVEDGRSR